MFTLWTIHLSYIVVLQKFSQDIKPFIADDELDLWYASWQENPLRRPEYYNKTRQQIKEIWEHTREKGTAMHNAIETYINGGTLELVDDSIVLSQVQEFFRRHQAAPQLGEKVCAEKYIFDERLCLAGAVDLLVRHTDGTLTISDWKRTKGEMITVGDEKNIPIKQLVNTSYGKYCLQINMYTYILESNYGYKVRDMFVVRFHDTIGAAQIVTVPRLVNHVAEIVVNRIAQLETQILELGLDAS